MLFFSPLRLDSPPLLRRGYGNAVGILAGLLLAQSLAFAADSASPGYSAPPAQTVQIGAGFSEHNAWHFSRELLDMLPPHIRAQFSAPGRAPSIQYPPSAAPYAAMPNTLPIPAGPPPVLGVPLSSE